MVHHPVDGRHAACAEDQPRAGVSRGGVQIIVQRRVAECTDGGDHEVTPHTQAALGVLQHRRLPRRLHAQGPVGGEEGVRVRGEGDLILGLGVGGPLVTLGAYEHGRQGGGTGLAGPQRLGHTAVDRAGAEEGDAQWRRRRHRAGGDAAWQDALLAADADKLEHVAMKVAALHAPHGGRERPPTCVVAPPGPRATRRVAS